MGRPSIGLCVQLSALCGGRLPNSARDTSPGRSYATYSVVEPVAWIWAFRFAMQPWGWGSPASASTPVEPFIRGATALADWLEKGRHGDMTYMAEHKGRADPKSILEQARTLIVVAFPYTRFVPEAPPMHGRVARYAMGRDYHTVMHSKLLALAAKVSEVAERPILSRLCVDSAPILEREAAERAGVGFIAKNTMSIAPGLGSYFFLGELSGRPRYRL